MVYHFGFSSGLMSNVPGSFRAKTGLLVPERTWPLLVMQKQQAEVRVYEVQP